MHIYVDVRGIWPVLVLGIAAITLEGADRAITVAEAQRCLEKTS